MFHLAQVTIFITLLIYTGAVNALGSIKAYPDLDNFFSSIQLSNPKGFVFIDTMVLNRD
ncbi:MAG: hypothetical protein GY727_14530 [Gammaproteobacteria bacterium]|nr:hypothetical protein [Gammaproteobacteria bacterium]MCP4277541.1 hypothetical protein [Gammaproteobacteria bacterium]MCP4831149.1 hypothetical protein [Gammaproteobacteria bacterium]MCP4928572.1 hypothetical protein [Gammaproteobacteria bacterium]